MTAGAIAVPTVVPLRQPVRGKNKNWIDCNTKIEIRTDTAETNIYYTINGSKPDPFRPHDGTPLCTLKYTAPFTLPTGKKMVKAVAFSKDGMRESHVVSKTFDVEYVPMDPPSPTDDGLSFQDQLDAEQRKLELKRSIKNKIISSTKSAWGARDTLDSRGGDVIGSNYRPPGVGTRFMNERLGSGLTRPALTDTMTDRPARRDLNTTQSLRIQRQTDYLKCPNCLADRPTDPYAKFCHECGADVPPLPLKHKLPQPEPGQIGTCVFCKSVVPFNTSLCVVCEAPIAQQNQPQASVALADKKVCTLCGTMNPSNLKLCLTCDSHLVPNTRSATESAPMSMLSLGDGVSGVRCSQCQRINNRDARFCDWCGTKPASSSSTLVCSLCRASNYLYANFCAACGAKLEPPIRNGFIPATSDSTNPRWITVTMPTGGGSAKAGGAPTTTVATQTVGLFYPSERDMQRRLAEEDRRITLMEQMSDKKPVLTAVSPGKGYWRKQMDHICGHLKAYASNDPEFRALIADPKMGRMQSATVHENGYELNLSVTFALRGGTNASNAKGFALPPGAYLSSHTMNDSFGSQSDLASEISTARSNPKKKSAKKVKKSAKKTDQAKLSPEDRKLLKEVGAEGQGRSAEIQQLIDEGADPSCVNKDDIPLLHVASRNKHADCIPVIVQAGVNVNSKGPASIRGNTALHEAILIGPSASTCIDALIGCGANVQGKNDKGETPYDLAVKAGYDSIVTRLAAAIGQNQLEKSLKIKT